MNDTGGTTVGERVMLLRKKRGYTREGLSESAEISAKFLYEIETDKKGFSAYTLVKLAQVLEVSTDYIMTGHPAGTDHAMTGHEGSAHLSCPFLQFYERYRQKGENGYHQPLHPGEGCSLEDELQCGQGDDGTLQGDT